MKEKKEKIMKLQTIDLQYIINYIILFFAVEMIYDSVG